MNILAFIDQYAFSVSVLTRKVQSREYLGDLRSIGGGGSTFQGEDHQAFPSDRKVGKTGETSLTLIRPSFLS